MTPRHRAPAGRIPATPIVVIGLALSGGACALIPTPPPVIPAVVIPTFEPTRNGACPTALLGEVVLRGDPARPVPVWVEDGAGRAYAIEWPNGYTARFEPGLVLLDPERDPVAREGDVLDLTGGTMGDAFDFFACAVDHHRPRR